MKFARVLSSPARTFFLPGDRGTGKPTWLQDTFIGWPSGVDLEKRDVSIKNRVK